MTLRVQITAASRSSRPVGLIHRRLSSQTFVANGAVFPSMALCRETCAEATMMIPDQVC